MFWSIISDYDLKTGVCELIDNALDLWKTNGQQRSLLVEVQLNVPRQIVSVKDNAGGVKKEDLRLLLAPGGSKNKPDSEIIGIFGVGSKRAGVAIGEQVQIKTRHQSGPSFEIEIDKIWLESPLWDLASYEIPDLPKNSTEVIITQLRLPFGQEDVDEITAHISETYSWFLQRNCKIKVNGDPVQGKTFDNWAFPPGHKPKEVSFSEIFSPSERINVSITAGLIRDRDPEAENYGVYFYCNDRLIVKELKAREVGYNITSEAGVPHPDASLCRVIVRLNGPAKLMPWNSSKTGINYGHKAFQQLRPTIIQLTSHFSSLSRRLKDHWGQKVFRYKEGDVENETPEDITVKNPLTLPKLPRVNKKHVDTLKSKNKTVLSEQPWTLGILEAMGAVEIIERQRLETRNRIALILLDSNFEIALKEFIVHRQDLFPPRVYDDAKIQQIFSRRHLVISEVNNKLPIDSKLLDKAKHYYLIRNKLIHERATVGVLDSDIRDYRSTIEKILKLLFKLKF